MATFTALLSSLQAHWWKIVVFLVILRLVRNHFKRGLYGIPGPFLASLSDVWLAIHCYRGKSAYDYQLHRKYNSPLLRVGPNTVAVGDAEAVRTIYGYKPVFNKSSFYITQAFQSNDGDLVESMASTMDEDLHAKLRRPVANAYAMSTLVGYEPLIDSTFNLFLEKMQQRFVETGVECDLATWLQMYAFDTIAEITFSTKFGFLESGEDVGNMMRNVGDAVDYTGIVGHLPKLDEYLRVKNFLLRFFRPTGDVVKFTTQQIRLHEQREQTFEHVDLLTRFIRAKEKYPEVMTEDRIIDFANSNVGAGSDTTAIILRECIYQVLIDPRLQERLLLEIKEVLNARKSGVDKDSFITWEEGVKMEFTQACIKECLRLNPAVGQMLPRNVPPGGVEVCGRLIPEGTVIGCNAWTVHRDKSVYGEDADEFRPLRWLEEDPEYIRNISNLSFAFGGGARTCLGKNIALLEITKFIPEFFRRFRIDLVDPARYTYRSVWLVTQSGLDVHLKARDQAEFDAC